MQRDNKISVSTSPRWFSLSQNGREMRNKTNGLSVLESVEALLKNRDVVIVAA